MIRAAFFWIIINVLNFLWVSFVFEMSDISEKCFPQFPGTQGDMWKLLVWSISYVSYYNCNIYIFFFFSVNDEHKSDTQKFKFAA